MDKADLITMLQVIIDNSFPTTHINKDSTVIFDVKQDSLIWVLEETIEFIKETGNLLDFIEKLQKAQEPEIEHPGEWRDW